MHMPHADDPNHDLARRAIKLYPIEDPALIFVRHNENLTYQVIDKDSRQNYLLRIHLPRLEGFRGIQQDCLGMESELAWIHALSLETDLLLQQPQKNTYGAYVTPIEHPVTGETIHCTLLSWIEGREYRQDDPQAGAYAFQLGKLNARLHAHAQSWQHPKPFKRPSYDCPELQQAMVDLERGIGTGTISIQDYDLADQAETHILDLLAKIERTPHTWGLVHADLPGNLLITPQGRLAPIDFSLSGFSFYLFDMGICLCNLKQTFRQPYLAGYGKTLTPEEIHHTEAFILMIILISAARQVANPEWKDWFGRRFPRIAREYCPMLLRGETFLFDI